MAKKTKTKIVDKDNGYDRRMKNIAAASGDKVTVGIHSEEGSQSSGASGGTIIQIAAAHEFGVGVPRRSWMRDTFDVKQAELKKYVKIIGEKVAAGQSSKKLLDQLGAKFSADIKVLGMTSKRGPKGNWQALSAETEKRKGSTTALLDTGALRASVTWETKA